MDRGTPFDGRYFIEPNTGCWLWEGKIHPGGYGLFHADGKWRLAHRVSYDKFRGPVADDVLVCHKCDTRPCVNPAHLFLGSYQDNHDDANRKGRMLRKLTPEQVRAIRADNRSGNVIAAEYGINRGNVNRIRRRETARLLSD